MNGGEDRFSVLGPVRAWHGGTEVGLGSPQQRVVVAVLLLRAPHPVPAEELVEAVWGEDPPRSAVNQLRIYAHRLRRARARAAAPGTAPLIESAGSGYRLPLPPGALDATAFETAVATAHRLRRAEPQRAVAELEEALALWRGTALGDLPGDWARAQRTRLEQARLDAVEARLRLRLELGRDEGAAAELAALAAGHPLDERFPELLMLALYRSGRQASALEVYARTRALLSRELGVDPGPELRRMHQRILHADDGLLDAGGPEDRAAGAAATTPGSRPGPAEGRPSPAAAASATAPALPVPAQLPFDLPVFSGRHRELAELTAFAEEGRAARAGTVLCVVAGSAGVGKTTFAVHAAHRLAAHYPDGRIHLDLHGFDGQESPLSPRRALRAVLDAFGVAADRVPGDLDAQAALYRSLLADRRVLLLLDNARDARQVRPLLPSAPGSLVLVTSRNQLSGLIVRDGARPLRLEALTGTEARALLVRRLGAARVDADPEATAAVVARGAGLPLALALIAARAAARRLASLAPIATELRELPTMLDALSDTDTSLDMRSVISWSYEALPPGTARMFRLFSLTPAPGCDPAALAALAALPVAAVRPLLAELAGAHLLDEPEPGRHTAHDLLREYAAEQLAAHEGEPERTAAFRRLLAHYLGTAYTAARTVAVNLPALSLHPEAAGAPVGDVGDPRRAAAWLARECEALLGLVERAGATPGCERQTWQLAWSLMDHLQRAGRWDDQMAVQRTALAAALRSADRTGQAHAHRDLARACTQAGRLDEATGHLQRALGAFEELGDLTGQARSHGNLALVLTRRGEHAKALPHVHRAVELFEAAGDVLGQASALNNLGWTYANTGGPREALRYCRQALELLQDAGDRVAEAATWDSLGYIHHGLGDLSEAVRCYHRALALDRALGDGFNEAETLTHLGETRAAMGDEAGAREAWRRAVGLFDELDPGAATRVRERIAALGPVPAAVAEARTG
ncbi:AfsR/SARP family transcriptional regulator [Streptomyces lichenis]|uniref:Tetratricopeptide repeat protein n=1 Tax=Streptomyces lichenis TaxID=2306967 RepID=A0ABT0IAA6_9ACTN|nr:BTAD domain-containing putative transcriptional regulator [Streptomyces lichenis]MCK8678219.1 tetratricopeptide repeat protein [Streptomyces lichenis]